MSKLDYFLLCETAITDTELRVSLINIFDLVRVDKFPVQCPRMVMAFNFKAEKDEIKGKRAELGVKLLSPKGKIIVSGIIKAEDVDPNKNIMGHFETSNPVSFEEEGTYIVKLLLDGKVIATKNLFVRAEITEAKT